AAALGALFFAATLVVASPFVFLAWLPMLLERPWLWLSSLPLALAGAAAVYAMLVAGAARVLERREPDLLQRVLGEALPCPAAGPRLPSSASASSAGRWRAPSRGPATRWSSGIGRRWGGGPAPPRRSARPGA